MGDTDIKVHVWTPPPPHHHPLMGNKGVVTNYGEAGGGGGGLQNGMGGGGGVGKLSFTPTEKRGGSEQVVAMLEGGRQSLGVVFQRKLDVLAILKRGAKCFYPLEGGMLKFLPCLGGWGKVSDHDFPIL